MDLKFAGSCLISFVRNWYRLLVLVGFTIERTCSTRKLTSRHICLIIVVSTPSRDWSSDLSGSGGRKWFHVFSDVLGTISYEKHQTRLIFVSSVTTVRQVRFADRLAIVYFLFQTGITVDTTN